MYGNRDRDFEIRKGNKIYISNLSSSVRPTSFQISQDELEKLFAKFGSISEVNLKQRETINFAFIEFSSTEEAEAAIDE